MAELPNFEVEEILGEFERDDAGNQIILQTADGKLNDMYGRLINRRGYLVDPVGNVVTRGNVFIFYKEEIDFDDEIPAPYCFQKTKGVKFTVKNFQQHRRMKKKDKLAMQNEFIEREYRKLKDASKHRGLTTHSQHYSDEYGPMGGNQSNKINYQPSGSDKPLSSHLRYQMESSGTALINQELGDANLSNLILDGPAGHGATYSDDETGLNADAFLAQNTT